jgi:hypothetical protein
VLVHSLLRMSANCNVSDTGYVRIVVLSIGDRAITSYEVLCPAHSICPWFLPAPRRRRCANSSASDNCRAMIAAHYTGLEISTTDKSRCQRVPASLKKDCSSAIQGETAARLPSNPTAFARQDWRTARQNCPGEIESPAKVHRHPRPGRLEHRSTSRLQEALKDFRRPDVSFRQLSVRMLAVVAVFLGFAG